MSAFAAGCAICGADLDAARAAIAGRSQLALPRRVRRGVAGRPARRPGAVARTHRIDWGQFAVAVLVALFVPPVGFLLGLYWGNRHRRSSEPVMAALMCGVAALALAVFFAPGLLWSQLLG